MVNFVHSTDTSQQFSSFLNPFLIERSVGSLGHSKVRDHIISKFTALGWKVEIDEFTDDTPHGRKTFTNIIARLNPSAKKFLTLSCHYDSKVFTDFKFIAATDSAVPCAMLVDIATTLDNSLKAKNGGMYDGESLQMVFFDGEEAFENWTPSDSIYGARHLAEKWSDNGRLDQMTSLILLDLIGGHPMKFFNYFEETSDLHERLRKIEVRLKSANLYAPNGGASYFSEEKNNVHSKDDYIPFLDRGVPVLHLISRPFPSVWHTEQDDAFNLDHAAITNFLRVVKVFLLEYFHLSHQPNN
ncbi:hypothetical protein CAPTEDRAFT_142899 [Capitella teleta]|uniref:Glutaminyl-peptide cyclotransferase n=1 Tax=Capitella teleta TaxID=283909 RepID=R7VC82_CAPTE|nr:hypothetical protein CAPTEDRAFT_142899 [Capitella teleta]|eukprot:ELU16214.1 hypothetical protein CAPTEDRAFT_142899 [Capitella teleta]